MSNSILSISLPFFLSVITASLAYYYSKRKQRILDIQKLKEESYKEFLNSFPSESKHASGNAFNKAFNSIYVFGNVKVIRKMLEIDLLHKGNENSSEEKLREKQNKLFAEMIKEIRKDIFGNNSKINKDFPFSLYIRG